MISAKFGPNQTNRFDIITLFVDFNRASAAILDFAHFVPGGTTCQNASGSQIDQYGMTFISANFHIYHKVQRSGLKCLVRAQLVVARTNANVVAMRVGVN